MDGAAKFGLIAIVGALGIGIGVLVGYLMAPSPKGPPPPTCTSIMPADGAANGYAINVADANGNFASGVLHFYPNGFRHNAVFMLDQGNSPSTDPTTLLDVAVSGGCVPADGTQPATITLTRGGAATATLQFSASPGDPNATFGVTLTPLNNSGYPPNTMTGSAYLIASQ